MLDRTRSAPQPVDRRSAPWREGGRPATASDPNWGLRLRTTGKRETYIVDLANVAIALRFAPELCGVFAYDEMAAQVVVVGTLPTGAGGPAEPVPPRPLDDADVLTVTEWLQLWGLHGVPRDLVGQAVVMVARERGFHPVREYLAVLNWDGQRRIGRWLSTYLGSERSEYTEQVGRWFLIAAVARVFRPGCQADYTLVLEGEQGIRKSSAIRVLAGQWFSDALPDLRNSKDASQHLSGRWIIEIAEMEKVLRADNMTVKAFLTRTTERYRRPYSRTESEEPRQCVFVGTINPSRTGGYLTDGSGGRRFWPVRVDRIDLDGLARDRDQIWAEAVREFRAGAEHWPSPEFEKRVIERRQRDRLSRDAFCDFIDEWARDHGVTEATLLEIAVQALNIGGISETVGAKERLTRRLQNRITAALDVLGWSKSGLHPVSRQQLFRAPGGDAFRRDRRDSEGTETESLRE